MFHSLGYRNFMLAIQSQILVLNKILSSAPKQSTETEPSASGGTTSGAPSGTSASNKAAAVPSTAQSSESLASQPVKPTLGKLRLVSAPSSSSISPNGSSLDSLEEESAEDALQHSSGLSEVSSGEVVEEGGCVIS